MWHKADRMGHTIRLELTHVDLLIYFTNHYTTGGGYIMGEVSRQIFLFLILQVIYSINLQHLLFKFFFSILCPVTLS